MTVTRSDVLHYTDLQVGDPAPWFVRRSSGNPNYAFNSTGGRYVILYFYESAAHPEGQSALRSVQADRSLFDDDNFCFFGVSIDPEDEALGRVRESIPGIRLRLFLSG